MRRWTTVAVGVVLLVAIGGAGVYAYDLSREDVIADGVRVGGVDVGGLRAPEANARVRSRLSGPLLRPVAVSVGGRDFRLRPADLGLRIDVTQLVRSALEESRSGNPLGRTFRALTGAEVAADVPVKVDYSRRALRDYVDRLKHRVDVPARDATVNASGSGVRRVPGRDGRSANAPDLERALAVRLRDPQAERVVAARLEVTKPKVTTAGLAERYPYFITVDRRAFRLNLYRRLRRVKSYVIAIGQIGFETPEGLYHIQNKAVNPAWSVPNRPWAGALAGRVIPPGPENPIKARWMGIYDGAGIHGTAENASLGSAASRGCIRMSIPEVKELYKQVPVRSPVYIG